MNPHPEGEQITHMQAALEGLAFNGLQHIRSTVAVLLYVSAEVAA